MPTFCVNSKAQANGDNEVHDTTSRRDCHPISSNQVSLGTFASCTGAVAEAKRLGYSANGCKICARACHTQ